MLSVSRHADQETCLHFGTCGGCVLQDLRPDDYRAGKRAAVQAALMAVGVNAEVAPAIVMPPRSRRRAAFKIARSETALLIGFHAARSHDIVDMRQCLVLTPEILALVQALRQRLMPLFHAGETAELHVTQSATGFDLAFRAQRKPTPALGAQIAQAIKGLAVARIVFNNLLLLEHAAPEIVLGGARVKLPPQAFLQSTAEGEAALQDRVLKIVGKAKSVADLFAGCGTFALKLAARARVHAVEQDGPALAALAAAVKSASGLKPVTTEVRDLFRLPLSPLELKGYDAVVMDPPRAGAEAQARALAASKVPVIACVSCDAASFARDAALLVAGGYRIGAVTPIDQFLWSSHIELVAEFRRVKA